MGLPFDTLSGLFNRPVAMADCGRPRAIGLLSDWANATSSGDMALSLAALTAAEPPRAIGNGASGSAWKPYEVIEGVALVPVRGVLVHRVGPFGWIAELLGIQGYDQIRAMFMQALADDDVDAIVLDVDSPGGDVAGCFDLVDTIFAARGVKPIRAILDECAYSAAYAIVSAVDPGGISVPRTGGTGSVGVIAMHLSVAEMLAKNGIEATEITKGAHKADWSELRPLSTDALARIQADVDMTGALFDRTVARNRGMAVADVTATQALTYQGAAGVKVGFADVVAAPDATFRALLRELG